MDTSTTARFRVVEMADFTTAVAVTYFDDYDEAKRLHDSSQSPIRLTQRRDPACTCGWRTASATYR